MLSSRFVAHPGDISDSGNGPGGNTSANSSKRRWDILIPAGLRSFGNVLKSPERVWNPSSRQPLCLQHGSPFFRILGNYVSSGKPRFSYFNITVEVPLVKQGNRPGVETSRYWQRVTVGEFFQ
ncbi:hypothetical protein SAMN05216420_11555 [Nitrosospira sp. Nl5]|nr:hypothetical protein SAMN05216420_11555 [Nitrosospira sp. Nl5]